LNDELHLITLITYNEWIRPILFSAYVFSRPNLWSRLCYRVA